MISQQMISEKQQNDSELLRPAAPNTLSATQSSPSCRLWHFISLSLSLSRVIHVGMGIVLTSGQREARPGVSKLAAAPLRHDCSLSPSTSLRLAAPRLRRAHQAERRRTMAGSPSHFQDLPLFQPSHSHNLSAVLALSPSDRMNKQAAV